MQVKEIDIDTGKKTRDKEFAKKKYEISFLGGPTTPTYSKFSFHLENCEFYREYVCNMFLNVTIHHFTSPVISHNPIRKRHYKSPSRDTIDGDC